MLVLWCMAYDMVVFWCGMVWCGMEWCGVVWSDVVWCGEGVLQDWVVPMHSRTLAAATPACTVPDACLMVVVVMPSGQLVPPLCGWTPKASKLLAGTSHTWQHSITCAVCA